MRTVIDQSGNIVLWHFWKLFLEYALETSQDDQAFSPVVVVDDPEFDLAIALLNNRGLEPSRVSCVTIA